MASTTFVSLDQPFIPSLKHLGGAPSEALNSKLWTRELWTPALVLLLGVKGSSLPSELRWRDTPELWAEILNLESSAGRGIL